LAGIFLQHSIFADSETNAKIPKCGTRKKNSCHVVLAPEHLPADRNNFSDNFVAKNKISQLFL